MSKLIEQALQHLQATQMVESMATPPEHMIKKFGPAGKPAVGDTVHIGDNYGRARGNTGVVTGHNGYGHIMIKSSQGKDLKFNKHGQDITNGDPTKWGATLVHKDDGDKQLETQRSEADAKKAAHEAKEQAAQARHAANAGAHREIFAALHKAGVMPNGVEPHKLKEIGREGSTSYYHTSIPTSSAGDLHHMFHKISHDVSISNPEPDSPHKEGHFVRLSYNYEHNDGGSNGKDYASAHRDNEGVITVKKGIKRDHPDNNKHEWSYNTTQNGEEITKVHPDGKIEKSVAWRN